MTDQEPEEQIKGGMSGVREVEVKGGLESDLVALEVVNSNGVAGDSQTSPGGSSQELNRVWETR